MKTQHDIRSGLKKILYFLKVRNERLHILRTLNIEVDFEEDTTLIDAILDLFGFPEDNTTEFDFIYLNGQSEIPQERKRTDFDKMFCRDWLSEKIMHFIDGESELKKDDELIDWLYKEYINMPD